MDFDGGNMVSILAFESRSIKFLLNDELVSKVMKDGFPLIYRNKLQKTNSNKFFYRNAIETALKLNQLGSVQVFLDFIVKHQNNYVSSFLLIKIMHQLIE